ncbi:FMN-linked oxidoreductase [Marasmius fiardii PR-910]|nr:FMN-linked oxidoreductase [Marasmius fiardii PR-910]
MGDGGLFKPITIGNLQLKHRVVLAPLTRFRADIHHIPLVPIEPFSPEATVIHPRAGGFPNIPGIWSNAQIEAWKVIVDAVHEKGSYINLQLWALGRAAFPAQLKSEDPSFPYVSASDIPLSDRPETDPAPRPLKLEEIQEYVQYYVTAAENAVYKAGFDGVEIHGGNGYLLEQFNAYGGSPENQARFALEVVNAVVKAVGPRRTGLRLSPWNTYQDTGVKDPKPTYSYLVRQIKESHPTFAYIHVVDPRVDGVENIEDVGDRSNDFIREIWSGGNENAEGRQLISAGNFDLETGAKLADTKGDLVPFGRRFLANPDLPYRLRHDIPLNPYDRSTFYIPGSLEPKGYTDYPFAPRETDQVSTPL